MQRVEREIMILKRINHPDVINLYEVVDSPTCIYLVMEYATGGELFDYIVARERVAELDACRLFHHIVNGLDHCHQRGVIHRDLKPENMLLHEGKLKLVDFGLGNITENGALLSTACGSPCYAAPEMIEGYKYDGSISDMWSAGVVLYALTCGFLPFEDNSTSKLYDKILAAEYEIPDNLSDGQFSLPPLSISCPLRLCCDVSLCNPSLMSLASCFISSVSSSSTFLLALSIPQEMSS